MAYEKLITLTASAIQAPQAEKDFIAKYASNEIEYVSAYKPNYMVPDSTFNMTEAEGKAEKTGWREKNRNKTGSKERNGD